MDSTALWAHHNHPAEPQRQTTHPFSRLALHHLRPTAAELILLGDLIGRYATGSYSGLGSDGRTVAVRPDRAGAAEHGHRITAAIACHVARAGGSIDELTRLLLHPDHEGGRHAQHIALRSGQARAPDYIRRVWASASALVAETRVLGSRHNAYEVLTALRDRIETTPWRGERGRTALRVLRAHLNFAETVGGPLHHAGERQTAEEAGISRTTLRVAYETVLKPGGWLRRLRVGHGREGSTWYLDHGSAWSRRPCASLSRFWTTQYPDEAERAAARNEHGVTAHVVMVKADNRTSLPSRAKEQLLEPAEGEGIGPDRGEPFPSAETTIHSWVPLHGGRRRGPDRTERVRRPDEGADRGMSEKNERPSPPARRTCGRTLGGAKKTTPPPLPRPPSSRPSSSSPNRLPPKAALARETGLEITVCHPPPGTSKVG
ncbi:hypothetical protein OG806_09880 [Streptomyces sp. NBC_00882]|uniref:hypothetical protein n=1 Tax=Streptomyces sp. NBC_00882 TaxID=2975856 RepID=UPI003864809A|nr:hypothetical protein OG806_09880 [Streptomyces sp. NBC_00882]